MRRELLDIGVRPRGVLLVHTSFRAVRAEGGPIALIEALREALAGGTLVMPTMTDGETPFDPKTTPSLDMGIVAETFWRLPGVMRSTHPGASFAAEGPHAPQICAPQPLAPPHGIDSPPGRVWQLGGQVLLLGVGHSESTVMHVAEAIAEVPYSLSYPVTLADGSRVMVPETDHCCRGFGKMEEWLPARRGRVGRADAMLLEARDVVAIAVRELRRDPFVFLCAPGTCEECDVARASVPLGSASR